ncbi:MAG: efflux RND transporter periplasmic adaptor subunit [Acidobacteria bacterium]|nr:efflux RND transporter periplasmic adaptor subunit [Acidobacteriota bacterium]
MRKKTWIVAAILLAASAAGFAQYRSRRPAGTEVTVETIATHDLQALVSASGKIRAKKTINISAETMGKVVNLAVTEGQRVQKGELLLEIDPRNLETVVQNREASLASARSQLEQTRSQIESARVALQQATDTLRRQQDLWRAGLIPRETYERAQNDLKMRETDLRVSEQSVLTQEQRIKVEEANVASARFDLNKVRVVAPIDGLITKRNVEEGETAVVGTMNNAGTVLLVVADMSIIETEIEVDETDVPYVAVGQRASVAIDAFPDESFPGRVTEVGNSPITTTSGTATTGRATNFKVVVQLEGDVPNVRPGFTCTATITTATRAKVLGVPIQAMTVRELIVDTNGRIVPSSPTGTGSPTPAPVVPKDGESRKELVGVFVVDAGRAKFVPVETGIAGEKYFEVLGGLTAGVQVITGPFASVRSLKDGDAVVSSAAVAEATPGGSMLPPPPPEGGGGGRGAGD